MSGFVKRRTAHARHCQPGPPTDAPPTGLRPTQPAQPRTNVAGYRILW